MRIRIPGRTTLFRLSKAVAFTAVFLILLHLLSPLLAPKSNGPDQGMLTYIRGRSALAEPADTLDILSIGNSNLYASFSPLDLWKSHGYAAYNVGEPMVDIYHTATLLSDILEKQHPRLLIIEADVLFQRSQDTEYDAAIAAAVDEAFPAVQFHNRWKSLGRSDFTQKPRNNWKSRKKGYLLLKGTEAYIPSSSSYTVKESIHPLIAACADRILSQCRERDIQVLITAAPCKAWNASRHQAVQHYADKRDIPFLDLAQNSDAYGFSWDTDSSDGGFHLNHRGAQKLTAYLGGYLEDHYTLPDHRGEAAYASWDTDYQAYQKDSDAFYAADAS